MTEPIKEQHVDVRLVGNPQPEVSFCLVTRGDVDLEPVLATVPKEWEVVIWNNAERQDAKVYGRYCAAFEANGIAVAFCDDDVIVPAESWEALMVAYESHPLHDVMVCNDAHGSNPAGYQDVGLVGAGAIVGKSLIRDTWNRWHGVYKNPPWLQYPMAPNGRSGLLYECDFAFGILCPHVTLKLPYTNRFPNHGDRLCDQPWQAELKLEYTRMARAIL